MTIPLTPQISLSPSSYSSSGQTITASVSVLNRPAYHGKPAITGLTTITPKIICSRTPSGVASFVIMVSACETSSDAGDAWRDLHFEWDFGDSSGTETFTDQWNGKTVNLNDSQTGPEAAYVYKSAGTYTITLTAKGRSTENGALITASTTTLLTCGMYFAFLGGATGGTYTITVDGQTTSAIAYNDTKSVVESALIALSNLDATNVKVTQSGCIEFFGSLAGATITVTADFSGLTGTTRTPELRVEQISATSSTVTVSDVTGLTTQYFDSTYDGSNGAANGTISRPYTTFASFSSFVTGGHNRIAYIKRGTTITMTAKITWDSGYNTIRIAAYGSGARPVIAGGAYYFEIEGSYGTSTFPNKLGGDIVWEEISFTQAANMQMLRVYASSNGFTSYIYSRYTDLAFVNCDYTSTTSLGNESGLVTAQGVAGRGRVISNVYVIGCDLDMGNGSSQGVFVAGDQWLAVIGGSFIGGDENRAQPYVFDHHIYSNIYAHQVYRYISFQAGNKSFCINGNAQSSGGAVKWYLCDGCDVTGTQNGLDFSNSDNDYASGRTGHFDQVIVQFNKIHTAQLNSQQLGIFGYNLHHIVIRSNFFWDCNQDNFRSMDITKPTLPEIYRNCFYNGKLTAKAGQIAYHHHNVYHTNNTTGAIISESNAVQSWDSDNNIFYAPLADHPFYNNTGFAFITFAAWQGYGNDANGAQSNPLWVDPDNGVFVAAPVVAIEWPATFTNFQYSLDNATWFTYTNNSDLEISASLSEFTIVYFRANTDAINGSKQIIATSDASSLEVGAETDDATLIGSDLVQFCIIQSAGQFLVLSIPT